MRESRQAADLPAEFVAAPSERGYKGANLRWVDYPPISVVPPLENLVQTRDEVLHVAYEAFGVPFTAPLELFSLLDAPTETAIEEAWTSFVHAHTDQILHVVRSLGGNQDTVMDRYTFVLERLREDGCRRLRAYTRPGSGPFGLWLIVVSADCAWIIIATAMAEAAMARREISSQAERAKRRRLVDLVADQFDPALLAAPAHGSPRCASGPVRTHPGTLAGA